MRRFEGTSRERLTAATAVIALVALACVASAEIHSVVLDNGLTLVVSPNPWSDAVAVSVMIGAGSKHDPENLAGLAQLTNEMIFEGVGDVPWNEVYDELSAQGIEFKCLTSEDTAEVLLTGHERRFEFMVDAVADALSEPAFGEKRLEYEKQVALASYEGELADDWNASYRAVTALLYDGHPYAITPLGTPEGIAAVTADDVASFHAEYYTPANTIVVAVGDLGPEATLAELERVFAGYDNQAPAPGPVPVPARTEMTTQVLYGGERAGFVQIGFAGPKPSETDDLAAIRVLMAVLGAGTESRLYRLLGDSVETEVTATGAFASHRTEQARLIVYALGASDSETVERILAEVGRLKDELPTEEEIERARENVISSYVIRMQRSSEKASGIARDHFLDLPLDCCESYVSETEAVTAEDVRAAAERYLVNPAVVLQRPGFPPKGRGI